MQYTTKSGPSKLTAMNEAFSPDIQEQESLLGRIAEAQAVIRALKEQIESLKRAWPKACPDPAALYDQTDRKTSVINTSPLIERSPGQPDQVLRD